MTERTVTKKGTKKPPEKKQVAVEVECDTHRLYGPLPGAIKYLQEIADQHPGIDIQLYENWTGYEDMSMTFIYRRCETDEEFERRVKQEREKAEYEAQQRQREAERQSKLDQYNKLRRELGL